MKGSVLRYRNRPASILTLEPSVHESIAQMGMTACALVTHQDPTLWEKASDTGFLNTIAKGAVFLTKIGRAKGPSVAIKDCIAHHAFITCLFLASQAGQLSAPKRANLHLTLEIFAECCPVDLPIKTLPPLAKLPRGLRNHSMMRKHYPAMLAAKSHYALTLADALRLMQTIERAPAPMWVPLMIDLNRVTEGLRTALHQTRLEKP